MRCVLGIESSCDDTAIALLRENGEILAHQRASQLEDHALYGGVVPEIAARAHLKALPALFRACMAQADITPSAIDAVAATTGPGLIGGVMVGAMAAKSLSLSLNVPFLSINHLEAHALVVRAVEEVAFPYLLLLASGGHCQIVWVNGVADYEVIGRTRDDALGEAFDKCAKMLGLEYPGGPVIETMAKQGNSEAVDFPRPMMGSKHADFSFSGLKTAVRQHIESVTESAPLDQANIADIAASFQAAAFDAVNDRVSQALTLLKASNRKPERLVVAGGVAANLAMRASLQSLCESHAMRLRVAPISLCTDNGVMIAWAGIERLKLHMTDGLDVDIRARWPLEELDDGEFG